MNCTEVKGQLVDVDTIICDAKTGVSGAGIKPSATLHYPSRYENMNAYKIAAHQHNCEIELQLGTGRLSFLSRCRCLATEFQTLLSPRPEP